MIKLKDGASKTEILINENEIRKEEKGITS